MGLFARGEVVTLLFPESDPTNAKVRPAIIVKDLPRDDVILCQITTKKTRSNKYSIELDNSSISGTGIRYPSLIRSEKLFTADQNKIINRLGIADSLKMAEVLQSIISLFSKK